MTITARSPDDELLGHLYDAVMAPDGFQKFIESLLAGFRLKAVTMIIRHVATQEIKGLWLTGISRESVESYALDYAREDMLALHIMRSPMAHFYASNLDLPNPERIVETRFYNEWIVPQGVAYAAGAVVLQEGNWLTQLFLQRAPSEAEFTRAEMDRLNRLVPHLQRTLQMRERFAELQLGQNFLAGGLDVLAMPTFLFDEYGRVAHSNRSAAALLREGGSMWLDNGHLQTQDRIVTGKLSLEIGNAISASRGAGSDLNSVVLLQRDGKLPLMLMVAPLRLANSARAHGAALLFAFDPESTPSVTGELVRRLFALSEAEAELAVALCCGKTLDDVAEQRGTSINTVKSQLKSVFLKTGTKRQSELVSLLLASPAYFLAQDQQGR
ncbi:DNA-binding CsgD family transcriptional regulator [Paucimonas lemoignei]|uniref:DNA-binding CsgD family transcriptional regulator n=1 Tax=Paucimonas lemoignei TaxID=29443 RepID=A0A4R3HUC4_PAULE|nr:helix-turn-helix transcriptional regulator [Paucimonas lemoignei]TCS36826.1 DNA-binding CsgD family transcriptional regulator [Paucimonas lemoignei]